MPAGDSPFASGKGAGGVGSLQTLGQVPFEANTGQRPILKHN
jgi:hypothetical protein